MTTPWLVGSYHRASSAATGYTSFGSDHGIRRVSERARPNTASSSVPDHELANAAASSVAVAKRSALSFASAIARHASVYELSIAIARGWIGMSWTTEYSTDGVSRPTNGTRAVTQR